MLTNRGDKKMSSPILEDFLIIFLQDRFYPDVEFYRRKKLWETFI